MMILEYLTEKTERKYNYVIESPRWLAWIDPFLLVPMMIIGKVKSFFKSA